MRDCHHNQVDPWIVAETPGRGPILTGTTRLEYMNAGGGQRKERPSVSCLGFFASRAYRACPDVMPCHAMRATAGSSGGGGIPSLRSVCLCTEGQDPSRTISTYHGESLGEPDSAPPPPPWEREKETEAAPPPRPAHKLPLQASTCWLAAVPQMLESPGGQSRSNRGGGGARRFGSWLRGREAWSS